MLFGDRGGLSSYDQIGHMGIFLGNDLMVHSSSQGVMISAVGSGWYADRYAFGKSVVPPAGVTGRTVATVTNVAVPAGVDPTGGQAAVGP